MGIWRPLSHHFYFSEGQDPPTVTAPPVPMTVAPHVTHTATRTTEHTTTTPVTESRTTQKPRGQPQVTQSRGGGETSDRSTTSRVVETTQQRLGILASVLCSVWWDYTAPAALKSISYEVYEYLFYFLSVWTEQSRHRVPGGWVLQHWPKQLCQDKRLHIPYYHLLSWYWAPDYTGLSLRCAQLAQLAEH